MIKLLDMGEANTHMVGRIEEGYPVYEDCNYCKHVST